MTFGNGPLALGDLDDDTNLDLIAAATFSDTVLLLLGNGDGTFSSPAASQSIMVGEAARILTRDLNDDDRLDFLLIDTDGNMVEPFLNATGGPLPVAEDTFRRGDVNNDGAVALIDAVTLLDFLFLMGTAPSCLDAGDFDDDGELDLLDGVSLLNYPFMPGHPPPAAPGPGDCGPDPEPDTLAPCLDDSGVCLE